MDRQQRTVLMDRQQRTVLMDRQQHTSLGVAECSQYFSISICVIYLHMKNNKP
jgi:hypothetical protein